MLYEWKKLGEMVRMIGREESLIKDVLFSPKGKTMLWVTFMRQLTTIKEWKDFEQLITSKKYKEKNSCSICNKSPARPLSKYIFPFIIDAQKFPNLYPFASPKSQHHVCKDCTLSLLSAYSFIFWYIDRKNSRFMGIMPYSEEKKILNIFVKRIISSRKVVESGNVSNITLFNNIKSIDRISFTFSYPYEFCFRTLYLLMREIPTHKELELLRKFIHTLRIFVLRIDNAFKSKPITTELNMLSIGTHLWRLFGEIGKVEESWKSFLRDLYLYTRKYETLKTRKNQQSDLVLREEFFKDVMMQRRIRGEIIEELLTYNLSKSEKKDKPKWYKPLFSKIIFKFLKIYYISMGMSDEKSLLEVAEKEGWKLGASLLEKEGGDKDKVKAYIYKLRRCRSLTDFMELINYLQLRADFKFDKEFIEITREKRKEFKEWKAYFLIGMANSILGKTKMAKGEKNEE